MQQSYLLIFSLTSLIVLIALITFINVRFYIKAQRVHKSLQKERVLLLKNNEEIDSIEKKIEIMQEEIILNEERLSSIERELVGIPLKVVLMLFKPSDN